LHLARTRVRLHVDFLVLRFLSKELAVERILAVSRFLRRGRPVDGLLKQDLEVLVQDVLLRLLGPGGHSDLWLLQLLYVEDWRLLVGAHHYIFDADTNRQAEGSPWTL